MIDRGEAADGAEPGSGTPASRPAIPVSRPAGSGDPAYLIYTSGSTGRPKGVVVTHRAIIGHLAWAQGEFGLDSGDRMLQQASASFDASVWQIFWPLCAGAAVVLAEPGGHFDPDYLAGLIQERRVTVLDIVPSMIQAFLATEEVAGDSAWAASLRKVFGGAEALTAGVARRWRELTGVPVDNCYGPTEATVQVTWQDGSQQAGSQPSGLLPSESSPSESSTSGSRRSGSPSSGAGPSRSAGRSGTPASTSSTPACGTRPRACRGALHRRGPAGPRLPRPSRSHR
nr:hypothetical protein GCM10020093_070550 [Planobispora longispora]